jgi:hypothetical protein
MDAFGGMKKMHVQNMENRDKLKDTYIMARSSIRRLDNEQSRHFGCVLLAVQNTARGGVQLNVPTTCTALEADEYLPMDNTVFRVAKPRVSDIFRRFE